MIVNVAVHGEPSLHAQLTPATVAPSAVSSEIFRSNRCDFCGQRRLPGNRLKAPQGGCAYQVGATDEPLASVPMRREKGNIIPVGVELSARQAQRSSTGYRKPSPRSRRLRSGERYGRPGAGIRCIDIGDLIDIDRRISRYTDRQRRRRCGACSAAIRMGRQRQSG